MNKNPKKRHLNIFYIAFHLRILQFFSSINALKIFLKSWCRNGVETFNISCPQKLMIKSLLLAAKNKLFLILISELLLWKLIGFFPMYSSSLVIKILLTKLFTPVQSNLLQGSFYHSAFRFFPLEICRQFQHFQ